MSKWVAAAFLSFMVSLGWVAPTVSAERAIIVLDGSGSMWAQIDGVARITIARETLADVLTGLPEDLELGLMTYGHRERGNCADIELLVEAAAGAGPAISEAANRINPIGMTPLSDAVRLAAEELRFTEQRATVILITDGLETCEVDPCQLGSELEGAGIDFTTHVVGFGLSDDEGQQVACLAENTGGRYISAEDGEALTEALTETVAEVVEAEPAPVPEPEPAPEPEPVALEHTLAPIVVMAEGGEPLERSDVRWNIFAVGADGGRGDEITYGYGVPYTELLEPGDYVVVAGLGEVEVEQPVTIAADAVAEPVFTLNAGTVILRAFAAEGEPVASGAALTIAYPGGDTYGYGEGSFVVPAGEQTVSATVGEGSVTETLTLAAGETREVDLIAGVGRVVVNAEYAPGMLVEESGLAVNIEAARVGIDGQREEITYGYGPGSDFELQPGDYVAIARLDDARAETPFTIEAGVSVEVVVPLDAGVVAITAPGASGFQIFGARTDIQGNRPEFGYAYGESFQQTLPAGDYVVRVRYEDDKESEIAFTVTAGERTEVEGTR
jgi:Ca-activated chloride channel family protein